MRYDVIARSAADGPTGQASFTVIGLACPQLPLRLINYFSQQGLLPSFTSIERVNGELHFTAVLDGIEEQRAEIIAEKMRVGVNILSAELAFAAAGCALSKAA